MLLQNPTYVFVSLAGATEAMLIAGFTTFLPKIIENQYQQTAGFAALVAGMSILIRIYMYCHDHFNSLLNYFG